MGRRYRIKLRRLIIVSVILLAAVIVAMLILRSALTNTSVIEQLINDSPTLEKVQTNDGLEYLVPESRVPETFDERMEAAALSLLPSRVPELENTSPPAIPPAEERAITRASVRFLKSWESFAAADPDSYTNNLTPLTASDYRSEILDRVDSTEPAEVCPGNDCLLGSTMIDDAPPVQIIDWNGSEAFVVGSGFVAYSLNRLSRYSGQFWSRSYGLLLQKEDQRWVVSRAAAENTAVVEP